MTCGSSRFRPVTNALSAPKAIAVAGASDLEGGNYYGARVLANLVEAGTSATIYPVNPRLSGTTLLDLPVFASLSDLPVAPDMVFVVTPVKFVIPTLEEAAGLGVTTSIVVTAENGDEDERRRFRERIARIARTSRMRIIGPNSMGIMNGALSLNGSFASGTVGGRIPPGTIACLSQSGATLSAMLQWFGWPNVGFSWLVSTGDESATGLEELMQAMVEDADVGSIMLFLEGVKHGTAFRRAALAARQAGKPVTMLQVGKSDEGREAVRSHTGRIAGTREVFAAVAQETGIIETESFVEFFSTGRTLAQRPFRPGNLPRNRRAAVVTVSGGGASLSADHLSALGWNLPAFSPTMVAALNEATGQDGIHNPADIGGAWRNPSKMTRAITTIAQDSSIDTIMLSMAAGGVFAKGVAEAIAAAAAAITQDVFVSWVGMSDEVKAIFDEAGIPVFDDFPLAARAAEACARFADGQANSGKAAEMLRVLTEIHDYPPASAGAGIWTVAETLADLTRAGLPCAPFEVADGLDLEDILAEAESVGYPVALKLSSSGLNHKSDDGGVAIRLGDRRAVEAAVDSFRALAEGRQLADVSVLVQKMESGIEILVGIKRDPSFGLILVVGLGGTLAELHAEVAATALPTTPATLRSLLSRNTRLSRLLDGYRGQPAVDREALVSFLADFARWAQGKGDALQEADLNPVMVSGKRISIVDARAGWA